MHSSFSTGQTEQMKRYSEFILQADGWEKSMLQHIRSGFPGGSEVKVSAWNAGDLGLILGSGRSPGEGNGNPLQYSCLENPMEGGAGGLQSMGSQRVRHDWAKKKKKVDCLLSKVLNAAIIGSSPQLKFLCYLSFFYYISSAFTKFYLKGEKCSRKSIVPEMGLISFSSFRVSF